MSTHRLPLAMQGPLTPIGPVVDTNIHARARPPFPKTSWIKHLSFVRPLAQGLH
jgi:hypothetical protein